MISRLMGIQSWLPAHALISKLRTLPLLLYRLLLRLLAASFSVWRVGPSDGLNDTQWLYFSEFWPFPPQSSLFSRESPFIIMIKYSLIQCFSITQPSSLNYKGSLSSNLYYLFLNSIEFSHQNPCRWLFGFLPLMMVHLHFYLVVGWLLQFKLWLSLLIKFFIYLIFLPCHFSQILTGTLISFSS